MNARTRKVLEAALELPAEDRTELARKLLASVGEVGAPEIDPVALAVANAPEDENPETPEERAAVEAAKLSPEWVSGEEVTRMLAERLHRALHDAGPLQPALLLAEE